MTIDELVKRKQKRKEEREARGLPTRVYGIKSGPKKARTVNLKVLDSCANLGELTGETESCKTCRGEVKLKVYGCSIYGTCTIQNKVEGRGCCTSSCDGYAPKVPQLSQSEATPAP